MNAYDCSICVEDDNPGHQINGGIEMLTKHVVVSHLPEDYRTFKCTACNGHFYDEGHYMMHMKKKKSDNCGLTSLNIMKLADHQKVALESIIAQMIAKPSTRQVVDDAAQLRGSLAMTPISNVSNTPVPNIKEEDEAMDVSEVVFESQKQPDEIDLASDDGDVEEKKPIVVSTNKTKNITAPKVSSTVIDKNITAPKVSSTVIDTPAAASPDTTAIEEQSAAPPPPAKKAPVKRGRKPGKQPTPVAAPAVTRNARMTGIRGTPVVPPTTRSSPRKTTVKKEIEINELRNAHVAVNGGRRRSNVNYRENGSDDSDEDKEESDSDDESADDEECDEDQKQTGDDENVDESLLTRCQLCVELQNNRPPMHNYNEKKKHATIHLKFSPTFAELTDAEAQRRPQFEKVMKMCFEDGFYEKLKREEQENNMQTGE